MGPWSPLDVNTGELGVSDSTVAIQQASACEQPQATLLTEGFSDQSKWEFRLAMLFTCFYALKATFIPRKASVLPTALYR